MLTLKDMMDAHRQFQGETPFADCFGDGYLYRHNLVYRKVREAFLFVGGQFTYEDFCHAKAFPWLCLPPLMNSGKVVIFNNVEALEYFEKQHPEISFDLFHKGSAAFIHNNLFHDPFHLVGHRFLFGDQPLDKTIPKTPDTVLRVLMAEALTHAAEALVAAHVDSEIHYRILNFNIHQTVSLQDRVWRQKALITFGPALFFRIFFFASLFGQFLNIYSGEEQIRKIFPLTKLPHRLLKEFDTLLPFFKSQMSETALRYRVFDAELFFRMLGFDQRILELLNFNFIEYFWATPELNESLEKIVNLISSEKEEPLDRRGLVLLEKTLS